MRTTGSEYARRAVLATCESVGPRRGGDATPLGAAWGAEVYLKLENLQHTGSFKARGALHKLLNLGPEERARGVVAASTDNHGAATAFAMGRLGVPGLVFVTEDANPAKVRAIRRLGVEVRAGGKDCVETEAQPHRHAAAHRTWHGGRGDGEATQRGGIRDRAAPSLDRGGASRECGWCILLFVKLRPREFVNRYQIAIRTGATRWAAR